MQTNSVCPDRDELERFLLGQLKAADVDRLERHLSGCPACLEVVQ